MALKGIKFRSCEISPNHLTRQWRSKKRAIHKKDLISLPCMRKNTGNGSRGYPSTALQRTQVTMVTGWDRTFGWKDSKSRAVGWICTKSQERELVNFKRGVVHALGRQQPFRKKSWFLIAGEKSWPYIAVPSPWRPANLPSLKLWYSRKKPFGNTEEIELEHQTFPHRYIYPKSNKIDNFLYINNR